MMILSRTGHDDDDDDGWLLNLLLVWTERVSRAPRCRSATECEYPRRLGKQTTALLESVRPCSLFLIEKLSTNTKHRGTVQDALHIPHFPRFRVCRACLKLRSFRVSSQTRITRNESPDEGLLIPSHRLSPRANDSQKHKKQKKKKRSLHI